MYEELIQFNVKIYNLIKKWAENLIDTFPEKA